MQKLKILPWVILGVSLLFTLSVWISFSDSESKSQLKLFENNIDSMTHSVSDRLSQYEQVLVSAKGLFAASSKVEFDEWHNYVEIQNIDERFPGIQGVGYIHHITNDERENLIAELNDYGIKDFTITPEGTRDEYYPIIFLEPQDFRNQRAMGYDIYFEESRHNAVETVKETGQTTITGKITLVQETEQDIQNGFLMLVPIYSNEQNILNASYDLEGMVYAVFRMNDFVKGIFDSDHFQYIDMKIYDNTLSEDSLFFDSDEISSYRFDQTVFSETITISVNNRDWIFVYDGVQPPLQGIEQLALFSIPVVGVLMSFLLFYILRLFTKNLKLTHDAIQTEKVSTIGTMASRMAHDLRNPLTVIQATSEFLKRDLEKYMDDKTKLRCNTLQNGVIEMNRIISDVLDFVRTSELNITTNSISKLLKTSISNIVIPDTVTVTLPETDVTINCDSRKIEAVFSNLLVNAIQAINDSGEIKIELINSTNKIIVSFVDSGPGIPKDVLSQIFDPLFTTKSKGTGLGLGICKSIIEQHHGTISAKNNPTTFTIELPKA